MRVAILSVLLMFCSSSVWAVEAVCMPYSRQKGEVRVEVYQRRYLQPDYIAVVPLNDEVADVLATLPSTGTLCLKGTNSPATRQFLAYFAAKN